LSRPKELWSEEFRPKNLSECVLPGRIQRQLESYVEDRNPPHLIFYGPAGSSKTTAAKCLASDIGAETLFFNASDETKKDDVMGLLVPFASSVSMRVTDSPKIIIADEAERLQAKAQDSIKGFLEQYAGNMRTVMTVNNFSMIIPPLKSRCVCIDFNPSKEDKKELFPKIYKRVKTILGLKGVEADGKVLVDTVGQFFPDFRKIINAVQSYSAVSGKIDEGILKEDSGQEIADAVWPLIKSKDFSGFRKTASESTWAFDDVVEALFTGLDRHVPKKHIPNVILALCDYSYKSSFVSNKNIALHAMAAELMAELAE
jgi:replication factor C small subunit